MFLPNEFCDIDNIQIQNFENWLENGNDAAIRIFEASPTIKMSTLLDCGTLPQIVLDAQASAGLIPDIRAYAVRNVLIYGASHVVRDGQVVFARDVLPPYVRYFYHNRLIRNPIDVTILARREISTPIFQVTNFNTDQYGHFLMESVPRLYVAKILYDAGFRFPILLPSSLPKFARIIAQRIHSEFQFIEYDIDNEVVIADCVIMPSMCHTDYIFHRNYLDFLHTVVTDCKDTLGGAIIGQKRIFISRRRSEPSNNSFRSLINIMDVEAILEERGFELVHPQEMTWECQASLFFSADIIIGEYGSGMHNALFSRAGTRIIAINWLNDAQQRIAQSRQHKIGFIMPEDGQPRWFSTDPTVRQDFSIDISNFQRAVDNILSVSPNEFLI